MKIRASYPEAHVKIEKGRTVVHRPGFEEQLFTIEIKMGRPGFEQFQFYTKHTDVCLPNLNGFVAEFDEFILDRSRTLYLGISYDGSSYLKISAEGLDVMLEYHIGEESESYRYTNSGAFEVGQEYLLQILAGLRDLIETQHGDQADETDCASI